MPACTCSVTGSPWIAPSEICLSSYSRGWLVLARPPPLSPSHVLPAALPRVRSAGKPRGRKLVKPTAPLSLGGELIAHRGQLWKRAVWWRVELIVSSLFCTGLCTGTMATTDVAAWRSRLFS